MTDDGHAACPSVQNILDCGSAGERRGSACPRTQLQRSGELRRRRRRAEPGWRGRTIEGRCRRDHDGDEVAVEVPAFFRAGAQSAEDPVTGSLNAALAQWLLADGTLTAPYVAAQGTALGRAGRVFIDQADGEIWVGGDAVTCIDGAIDI